MPVEASVERVRELLGRLGRAARGPGTVFLTGGDAPLVREAVPQARVVPDLVFVGLAMACPLD